jgi:hypothetical protein
MSQISNGAVVTLECQGTIPGPKFLDGLTETGGVKLSPQTDGVFTGTHWQCSENPDGTFTLACAGAIQGVRYLDGRTGDGTVGLAGDTLPPFSGTQWRVVEVIPDIVTIQCIGDPALNRFLNGLTDPAISGVALAESTDDPPFSGTKWRALLSASPSLSVTTIRNQLGATLELSGVGFTPGGDSVNISAEGIIGRENHAPFALGFANIDPNTGTFTTTVEIEVAPVQPNNPQVVIRATDHNGISAVDFTDGFTT